MSLQPMPARHPLTFYDCENLRWSNTVPMQICASAAVAPAERKRQMLFHRRPLAGDDAVDDRVAQRSVVADLVAAQDAVELRAEPLDALAAGAVEEVRAEFDGDAVEPLERVR